MEVIGSVLEFVKSDAGVSVLVGLLVFSEALGGIPAIKANSVYQVIIGILQKIAPKKP